MANKTSILETALKVGPSCEVKSWKELKKLLLLTCNPELRSEFSRRDEKTKEMRLNDFEKWLIDIYEKKTGTRLSFYEPKE
jgi:hypothetical protein